MKIKFTGFDSNTHSKWLRAWPNLNNIIFATMPSNISEKEKKEEEQPTKQGRERRFELFFYFFCIASLSWPIKLIFGIKAQFTHLNTRKKIKLYMSTQHYPILMYT